MTTTLPITTSGPLAPDYVVPSQTAPEQTKPVAPKPRGRLIHEVQWDFADDCLVIRSTLGELHIERRVHRHELEAGLPTVLDYMAKQLFGYRG